MQLSLVKTGTPARDVHLAKTGNKEAFAGLIEANKTQLYRVAKGIVSRECDIEDAIQETILKAWSRLSSLKKDEFFKTWLIRILINECYSLLRQRDKSIELDQSVVTNFNEAMTTDKLDVWHALNTLDQDLRTVVLLFYFEDIGYKDISRILNLPEGTVKSRLSRAKGKLGKILSVGKGGE